MSAILERRRSLAIPRTARIGAASPSAPESTHLGHSLYRREGSFVIGDRPSDIEAGEAVGLPAFLFTGGDLDAFVAGVIAQTSRR